MPRRICSRASPRFRHPVILVCVALILAGCDSGNSSATIDFSKTVDLPHPPPDERRPNTLRVAVAAIISPEETLGRYHELLKYIGSRLNRDIHLVQRKTYGEIDRLLGSGDIDLAFICSGPYATGKDRYKFQPIAAPVVRHKETYRSYLIVNKDSPVSRIEDLRDLSVAYTDPASNTGCMVPNFLLKSIGEKADHFFKQIVYTHSHDNSIMAVARALVDGAFVHEQIWEYYMQKDPQHTSRTRVVYRSPPFGNPPIVASPHLPDDLRDGIRRMLFGMHSDPQGKTILEHLLIERFVPVREHLYEPIRRMYAELNVMEGANALDEEPSR